MLTETFLHLPGVGPRREQALWAEGIRSWTDAVDGGHVHCEFLGYPARDVLDRCISASESGDWRTVARELPGAEHWRALCAEALNGEARPLRWLALDIETTGLAPPLARVTVVGLCGHATGFAPLALVADRPKWQLELSGCLEQSDVLVTFNGKRFDVPFLAQSLGWPQERFPPFHVDLFPLWKRLGEKGGLKSIQARLLGRREGNLQEVDGYTAVKLWAAHRRGTRGALDTLTRYCLEDVVVLLTLAEMAYDRASQQVGRPWKCWPPPPVSVAHLPYDPDLVRRLTFRNW